MNAQDVLKTYAIFYVSENDEFDSKRKLDMLNFIEQADESMLMDLFENGEIESPEDLLESDPFPESSVAEVIGESVLTMASLEEKDFMHSLDMWKNSLKDLLGQKTSLKYKLVKADYQMRPKISKAIHDIDKKIDILKDKIADASTAVAKGAKAAGEKAGELAGQAHEKLAGAQKAVWKGAGDVGRKAGETIEKGVETGKELASHAGEKISGAASKAAEYAQGHPGMVGATVAAAAALTAGVMAYRRFFSKAAKACKNAPDRAACLQQYKIKAKQAQISALNAGKAKCAKSKKPDQCKAKIDAKIASIKSKMRG